MIHYFQSFYFLLSLFLLGYLVIAIAKYNRTSLEYPVDCTVVYKPQKMDIDILDSSHAMFSDLDPYNKQFEYLPPVTNPFVHSEHETVIKNMINDENTV